MWELGFRAFSRPAIQLYRLTPGKHLENQLSILENLISKSLIQVIHEYYQIISLRRAMDK